MCVQAQLAGTLLGERDGKEKPSFNSVLLAFGFPFKERETGPCSDGYVR